MAREKNWAEEAAKAMADLHMFSAVQVLSCELADALAPFTSSKEPSE